MYDLQTLIFYAKEKNTSDVHLTVGLPPMLRIDGELRTHGDVPLTEQDVQDAAQQLADEHQLHELKTIGESDFAVTFADSVRMRCNLFRQQHHTALALRLLPMEIPTAEQLRLTDIIIQQAEKPRGLGYRDRSHRLRQKFHTGGTDRPRQPHRGTPYHHA